MSDAAHILIFSRFPVPGRTKTRLIPVLRPEGAALMHRRMAEHSVMTARAARKAYRAGKIEITLCTEGAPRKHFRAWLGTDLRYASQPTGDLGVRQQWAFKRAFRRGASYVLLFGSDLPDMLPDVLLHALDDLRSRDVVLGPASDGGYYLIGMKRLYPELFRDIKWGTKHVLDQTRNVIKRLGLTLAELETQSDVDRPEDLPALRADVRFADVFTNRPLVSAIIPTFNEDAVLGHTLDRVRSADHIEIIVADGESTDCTRSIAEKSGAHVVTVPGGRALQLNAGAAAANGRLLLFLHADTIPPEGFENLIRRALNDPTNVAGAFRFQTDSSHTAIRVIEWIANIRSVFFQWPYGDQGLFLEKRVFDEVGGFATLPIMEDFDLVRRLRRRGRVNTLSDPAITSARRWRQLGILRTTIINQLMIAGFIANVPMHLLERFYRNRTKFRHQ